MDETFDEATTIAVTEWQEDLLDTFDGVEVTGSVGPGDLRFGVALDAPPSTGSIDFDAPDLAIGRFACDTEASRLFERLGIRGQIESRGDALDLLLVTGDDDRLHVKIVDFGQRVIDI